MITTPWIHHFISGLKNTLPLCMKCNNTFHPNGRELLGRTWVKDDRFTQVEPANYIECR